MTIWGFADSCTGQSKSNDPTKANNRGSYTIFQFNYVLYKDINSFEVGEKRFANQSILAQSPIIKFNNKCWNSYLGSSDNFEYDSSMTYSNDWIDQLFHKEITDFSLGQENRSTCTGTGCFIENVTVTSNPFPETFLYSNTSATESYFMIQYKLQRKDTTNAGAYIPGPWKIVNNIWQYLPGYLNIQFSKTWLTSGDKTCYFSWANINDTTLAGNNTQTSLIKGKASNTANFISTTDSTISVTDIVNNYTPSLLPLPTAIPKIFRIKSNLNTPAEDLITGTNWFYLYDAAQKPVGSSNMPYDLIFFSTCVKTQFPRPSTITSIYSYFDVQVQWLSTSTGQPNGVVSKNIRYIKLFPEAGVFNDWSKIIPMPTGHSHKFHYSLTSSTENGICILEVLASSLNSAISAQVSTIVLFLGFATILETDYHSTQIIYPAAPITTGISITGLPSAYPMNKENDYVFTSSDNLNKSTSAYSAYYWYMGSVLYINNITTPNVTVASGTTPIPNLLVPFYCPLRVKESAVGYSTPTLIGISLNINSSFANFSAVSKIIGVDSSKPKAIMFKGTLLSQTSQTVLSILAWDGYITQRLNPAAKLYIYNGTRNSLGTTLTCTGISVFLHIKIAVTSIPVLNYQKTTTTFTTNNTTVDNTAEAKNNMYTPNSQGTFYILGKPFNLALLYSLPTVTDIASNLASATTTTTKATIEADNLGQTTKPYTIKPTSKNYITGIIRPSGDEILDTKRRTLEELFDLENYVSFSCVNKGTTINTLLSNYLEDAVTGKNAFLLDFNVEDTSNSNLQFIIRDIEVYDKYYIKDPGFALQFIYTPYGENFRGQMIRLTSNYFSASTICGFDLSDKKEISTDCLPTNGNYIDCPLPYFLNAGTSYNTIYHCYNIDMRAPVIPKTYSISKANLVIPRFGPFKSHYNEIIYDKVTSGNVIEKETSKPTVSLSTIIPKINSIRYSHVFQDSGLGQMIMTINLNRELPRDLKITIYGDFSKLVVPGVNTNCRVTFTDGTVEVPVFGQKYGTDNRFDKGDGLVSNCNLNNISKADNTIVITTKKMMYKSNIILNNIIKVILWPVIEIDTNKNLENNYRVTLQIQTGNEDLANNDVIKATTLPNFPSSVVIFPKPTVNPQWDKLCPLIEISPGIASFTNSFIFEFDTYTNKTPIDSTLNGGLPANEVSIFFPFEFFGDIRTKVVCMYKSIIHSCDFADSGILNISIPDISIGAKIGQKIEIFNIQTPNVPITAIFPCSINYVNSETGKRRNLLVGSGSNYKATNTFQAFGNLRFLNSSPGLKSTNPRELSGFTLWIKFDNTTNMINYPITLNKPWILITLPDYYNMAHYSSKYKVSTSFKLFKKKANGLPEANPYFDSSTNGYIIDQQGNNIIVGIISVDLVIDSTLSHVELTLTNLFNPSYNINITGASPFIIGISNDLRTKGFRTFNNLINISTAPLNPPIDNFITNSRGFQFIFDTSKLVVDFYPGIFTIGSTIPNSFILFPGRYLSFNIVVTGDLSKFISATSSISLKDTIFQTNLPSYNISTVGKTIVSFFLGTKCGTLPGNYVINFDSTNIIEFFALSSVDLKLDITNRGKIDIYETFTRQADKKLATGTAKLIARPGFSSFLYYQLSDPTVDTLSLEWKASNPAKVFTSQILPGEIPAKELQGVASLYGSKLYNVTQDVSFTAVRPNSCFYYNTKTITLSFGIFAKNSTQSVSIPGVSNKFFFNNSLTSSKVIDKASIEFDYYIPTTISVYLYCSLVCYQTNYPTDTEIYQQTLPQSNILQYYNNLLDTKLQKVEITFNNLIRGWQYKMKCHASTADFEINKRLNNSITYHTYYNFTASNIAMKTEPTLTSECMELNFLTIPTKHEAVNLLNKCQKHFIKDGYASNGCISCGDTEGNVASGFEFPNVTQCGAPINNAQNSVATRRRNLNMFGNYAGEYANTHELKEQEDYVHEYEYIPGDQEKLELEYLNEEDVYENISNNNLNNEYKTAKEELYAANNPKYIRLQKRRYLQASNLTTTSTSNTTNAISNALTSNTTIGTTNTTTTGPGKKYPRYIICASQSLTCTSNINKGGKTLSQLFTDFASEIKDVKTFSSIIGLNVTNYEGINNRFKDSDIPDLTAVTIQNFQNSITNDISWTAVYKHNLICHWRLDSNSLNNPPLKYDIENCKKPFISCGQQRVNSIGVTELKTLNTKLVPGSYNLWFLCRNDLPNSQIYSVIGSTKTIQVRQGNNGATITESLNPSAAPIIVKKSNLIETLSTKYIGVGLLYMLSCLVVLIM